MEKLGWALAGVGRANGGESNGAENRQHDGRHGSRKGAAATQTGGLGDGLPGLPGRAYHVTIVTAKGMSYT